MRTASSCSIVGPSGCGKSTLLKILAGLMQASGGQALLNGTPTGDLITNDLIDDINKFDAGEIEKMAKGWKG